MQAGACDIPLEGDTSKARWECKIQKMIQHMKGKTMRYEKAERTVMHQQIMSYASPLLAMILSIFVVYNVLNIDNCQTMTTISVNESLHAEQ